MLTSVDSRSPLVALNVPGPKAQKLIARDQKVISQSYPRGYGFVMDHGQGAHVYDVDGNCFLDFMAGIAVAATGYSHPRVVKAIQEQAEEFIHISSDFYHETWIKLAEKLNDLAPFRESAMTFMTNSGTESVEGALKTGSLSYGAGTFHRLSGRVSRAHVRFLGDECQQSVVSTGFFLCIGRCHSYSLSRYLPSLAHGKAVRCGLRRNCGELSGGCDIPEVWCRPKR